MYIYANIPCLSSVELWVILLKLMRILHSSILAEILDPPPHPKTGEYHLSYRWLNSVQKKKEVSAAYIK